MNFCPSMYVASKTIYHRGASLSEHAVHADLIFCHGIQTMNSSKICHCCCFMSVVSKKLCAAISPVKEATTLMQLLHWHTVSGQGVNLMDSCIIKACAHDAVFSFEEKMAYSLRKQQRKNYKDLGSYSYQELPVHGQYKRSSFMNWRLWRTTILDE